MKTGYFKQIDNNLTMGYVSISLYPSKKKMFCTNLNHLPPIGNY